MNFRIRACICAVMAIGAAASSAKAIGSIAARAQDRPAYDYDWGLTAEEAAYVLRDWDGYIGVFASGEARPMSVTDIELATLREADRAMLESGVFVRDREELLQLLEDLGS